MFVNTNKKGWQKTWLWPVCKHTAGFRLELDRTQFFLHSAYVSYRSSPHAQVWMWQAWEKREMGAKREWRKLFGRSRHKYESNIQSDLKEYAGWVCPWYTWLSTGTNGGMLWTTGM